ncbi:hypothetical protein CANARDRAFT_7034, partial [[Candida] arabinofermentans NRRL YB-2248]
MGPYNGVYGLIVKNIGSQYMIRRILTSRTEVSQVTIDILKILKNQLYVHRQNIGKFRSDNEFRTNKLSEYCTNGSAENANHLNESKIKRVMFDSKLPNRYWIYAFNHSIFLHNVLPRSGSDISPHEKSFLSGNRDVVCTGFQRRKRNGVVNAISIDVNNPKSLEAPVRNFIGNCTEIEEINRGEIEDNNNSESVNVDKSKYKLPRDFNEVLLSTEK